MKTLTIDESHTKSIIIGLWRQGATNDEISYHLNLTIEYVKQVIKNYQY